MRKLIKQRDLTHHVVTDEWRYLDESAHENVSIAGVIVPLTHWLSERDSLLAPGKQVGVRVGPADKIELLEQDALKLQLIALEFGGIGEGRGYSQAHILRRRYGFTGELRAVGKIQRDQLFYMARCGFDAFELPEAADLDVALTAFKDYSVAYQPGVDQGLRLQKRAS